MSETTRRSFLGTVATTGASLALPAEAAAANHAHQICCFNTPLHHLSYFHLTKPYPGTVYLKDFVWEGQKPKNVSLGQGQVDLPAFVKLVQATGSAGPISLHMKSISHKDPALLPRSIEAIRQDLATLKKHFPTIG